VTELHSDVVAPGFAEPVAREVRVAIPAFDRQGRQKRPRPVVALRPGGRGGRGLMAPVQPSGHRDPDRDDHDEHRDEPASPGGNAVAHIAVLALEPVEC
jgi:hypothetical protein